MFSVWQRPVRWVEVRAVGGEIKQICSPVFDPLAHAAGLVRGKIVAQDAVAAAQFGGEDFLHIGQQHGPVHRAIEEQRRGESVVAQGGDEGGRAPVAMRHGKQAAPGGMGPPVKSRHLGVEVRFFEKNELGDRPSWVAGFAIVGGPVRCRAGLVPRRAAFFTAQAEVFKTVAEGGDVHAHFEVCARCAAGVRPASDRAAHGSSGAKSRHAFPGGSAGSCRVAWVGRCRWALGVYSDPRHCARRRWRLGRSPARSARSLWPRRCVRANRMLSVRIRDAPPHIATA